MAMRFKTGDLVYLARPLPNGNFHGIDPEAYTPSTVIRIENVDGDRDDRWAHYCGPVIKGFYSGYRWGFYDCMCNPVHQRRVYQDGDAVYRCVWPNHTEDLYVCATASLAELLKEVDDEAKPTSGEGRDLSLIRGKVRDEEFTLLRIR